MEYRQIEAERPWAYVQDESPWSKEPRRTIDIQSARYKDAIVELREALADGEWHDRKIAKDIAKKYKVRPQPLCDRAGVYFDQEGVIWPNA